MVVGALCGLCVFVCVSKLFYICMWGPVPSRPVPVASRPVPSRPDPSHPVTSRPVPSRLVPYIMCAIVACTTSLRAIAGASAVRHMPCPYAFFVGQWVRYWPEQEQDEFYLESPEFLTFILLRNHIQKKAKDSFGQISECLGQDFWAYLFLERSNLEQIEEDMETADILREIRWAQEETELIAELQAMEEEEEQLRNYPYPSVERFEMFSDDDYLLY